MAVYGKTLVSVEIATTEKVWNRTYLATYVPTDEQFLCYYRVLCGFADAEVTVKRDCVPDGFNAGLLKPLDTAPTVFPQSDIETDPEDTEKRTQYKQFIQGLLEMENSRVNLNFFIEKPKESTLSVAAKDKLDGFRAWVHEVLESLDVTADVVDSEGQTFPTIGWIITPSAAVARRDNGYRLITDQTIGGTWETLLGSDHFPDLIVARRLHASRWTFPSTASNELYHNILTWYLQAKNAVYAEGVSDWLPTIDLDVNMLLAAFQTITPTVKPVQVPKDTSRRAPVSGSGPKLPPKALLPEAYIAAAIASQTPGADPEFDTMPSSAFPTAARRGRKVTVLPTSNFSSNVLREEFKIHGIPNLPTPVVKSVTELLSIVEKLMAPAAAWPAAMEPASEDTIYRFLSALCEALKLRQEELESDSTEHIVQRWISAGYGFRPELWPVIPAWFGAWRAIIRDNATETRILFFLQAVSIQKLPETHKVDITMRDSIVHGWLTMFLESFMIVEQGAYVQATDLHEQSRLFCLQFTPEMPWTKYFTPMAIGPYFTTRGFITKKGGAYGRRTFGIRYRRPNEPPYVLPRVQIHATIHTSTVQTTVSSEGVRRTETNEAMEINLGAL